MGRPRALVLGGYGLIGSACMAALETAGFAVAGLGRSRAAALTAAPGAVWILRDMTAITADEWRGVLADIDVVVNAAGALQDGAQDALKAIHVDAVAALAEALDDGATRLVQISAAGVSPTASTYFLRTKAQGDAIVASEVPDWVILRPTLVLSPEAYGGTAVLRAAAALPGMLPQVCPRSLVQTVHVADVAAAVVAAARGEIGSGTIADLTEAEARPLPQLTARMRRWLGLPPARWLPVVPDWQLALLGRGADLLGHLGWRSPLRSTALTALRDGITGDPGPWSDAGGAPCRPLDETLALLPSTRQERLFARMFLALPLAIGTLSLFWLASGVIGLLRPAAALDALVSRGTPLGLAVPVVLGGAAADVLLGLALLLRRWTRTAALGMALLSGIYLLGGAIVAPDLWADPLGPMLKVFPGIVLALIVWLAVEDR